MNIIQRLSLLWRRFSPLEERLIAAVREILPERAQPIFDAQIAGITLVQRLPRWTEIDFYRRRKGQTDWSDVPAFPRTGEFPLAEVRFTVAKRRYKATLYSIGGHIFDFAITPGPKAVAFVAWDGPASTRLLADPLVVDSSRMPEPIPVAWREFLAHRQGARPGGWTFHDADTARRVTLEEGEFLILAERPGDEYVMNRIEPPASVLYLASHNSSPEPIEGDLSDVFREI